MNLKKIRKEILRFVAWLGLMLVSLILKALPGRWLYGFAGSISSLGYRLAAKQRKIALESLDIALGREKSREEIEKIAQTCFLYMAKSAVELLFLMDRPELLKQQVELAGKEHLKSALAKGKGVILVSAHFGNFPLLMAKLSLEGYKVAGIMRPMRDQQVEKLFLAKRNRLGIKTIYSQPRKTCVDISIRSLRDNELIFIPLDQNFGTGGVFVDFFGTKAATATGPLILAKRTGACLLPCFIVRQKDDTHKIYFEAPLNVNDDLKSEEAIVSNVQVITSLIERYIRKYPAEWGWIHRRWKSRPANT